VPRARRLKPEIASGSTRWAESVLQAHFGGSRLGPTVKTRDAPAAGVRGIPEEQPDAYGSPTRAEDHYCGSAPGKGFSGNVVRAFRGAYAKRKRFRKPCPVRTWWCRDAQITERGDLTWGERDAVVYEGMIIARPDRTQASR
jgi:hypothetical protein